MTEWFIYFPPMSVKPQIIGKEIRSCTQFLRFCYQTIGCSSIETVRFSSPTDVLIVDEEGLLKDDYQINMVGSALTESLIAGGMIIAQQGVRDGEPDLVGFPSMDDAAASAAAAQTIAKMRYNRLYGGEVSDHA